MLQFKKETEFAEVPNREIIDLRPTATFQTYLPSHGIKAFYDIDKKACPLNIKLPTVIDEREIGMAAQQTLELLSARKYYLRDMAIEIAEFIHRALCEKEGIKDDVQEQLRQQVMAFKMVSK